MNIGIVCYPTFGGSGVLATELGLALAERGHHVHFITYNRPARLHGMINNVRFHEVTPSAYPLFDYSPYDSALVSKMVDTAKYEKLDLFHVHYAIPHSTAGYLAKQILKTHGMHVPIITTLHGTDITLVGNDASFFPVVEFGINQSDGVTAVSNFLKKQTLETFNITRDIEVIYNFTFPGITKYSFDAESRLEFARPDEKILIHISNFRKLKRVGDVVHIFERVRKEVPSKLLLVGDGPERARLETYCRQNKLCNDIEFLGKQDAVGKLLSFSDLFLLPSSSESFGLVALEAMACAVPVISSNAEGIPEVNEHGFSGFTSDVGDVEDMAKNALDLLLNPAKHDLFRQNAKEKASEFVLDKILTQYEAYYLKVLTNVKTKGRYAGITTTKH